MFDFIKNWFLPKNSLSACMNKRVVLELYGDRYTKAETITGILRSNHDGLYIEKGEMKITIHTYDIKSITRG